MLASLDRNVGFPGHLGEEFGVLSRVQEG